jgi:hypothetical protein
MRSWSEPDRAPDHPRHAVDRGFGGHLESAASIKVRRAIDKLISGWYDSTTVRTLSNSGVSTMPFWIRAFENSNTGHRLRVHSEAQYLPSLRQQVAVQQEDAEWLDDVVYKHDAGLDIKLDGGCPLKVEPIE